MLEMSRIGPEKIKMIPFCFSRILLEIVFCQHRRIHRSSLKRIRAGFSQIIIIVFRQNTEPNFVETRFFQRPDRLINQLICLQLPDIAGCADRIVRRTVRIAEIKPVVYPNRSVIARTGFRDRKISFLCFPKGAPDNISVLSRIRRHKADSVHSVSIVKTIRLNCLGITKKCSPDRIIRKGISVCSARIRQLQTSPPLNTNIVHFIQSGSPALFVHLQL